MEGTTLCVCTNWALVGRWWDCTVGRLHALGRLISSTVRVWWSSAVLVCVIQTRVSVVSSPDLLSRDRGVARSVVLHILDQALCS